MRPHLLTIRAVGAAACILTLAGAQTALLAPAAHAEGDAGTITVTPSSAHPGQAVDLRVFGCTGTTGQAVSEVFVSDAHLGPSADQDSLFAEATVKATATPGEYRVFANCGGEEAAAQGTLHVLDAPPSPDPYASPVSAVHAGGGGTATMLAAGPLAQTDEDEGNGPGARHAVIGLALAGVAAVAVAARSVRRRRGQG
ncbi:hypothetical protein [Streptomyces sp. NPDC060194]|uniref:hypothetical protein n=1 Tax=Streptomyces sp. NPDC060194 TaxID=3347069 RepID=UPI00365AB96F